MMRRYISLLIPAVLFAAGCAELEAPGTGALELEQTVLATKSVNTSDNADQGSLLLFLDEDVALALAQGEGSPEWEAACAELGVDSVEKLFPRTDDEMSRSYGLHRWFMVSFPQSKGLIRVAEGMAELNLVKGVQFNTIYERDFASEAPIAWKPFQGRGYGEFDLPFNDPMLVDQWHYINNKDMSVATTSREGADINVKNAWGLTAGDPRIIVAVCDEGVKYTHPDLAANMWVNAGEIPGNGIDDDDNGYVDDIHGWNFLHTEKYPKEISWNEPGDVSHGTHVAGTVAAVNNNGIGISGVAGGTGNGDGCRIMSCQVFSGSSSATTGARARAYHYAAQMGASVLQCSYGQEGGYITSDNMFDNTYSAELAALRYFREFGNSVNGSPVDKNIIVFAAGNDGTPMSGYPAAHKEFISVTAFGPDYLPATYTNYGPGANIAAPGGDVSINMSTTSERAQILSTTAVEAENYDSNYGWMQGTSMACPHVSGVVALGLSYALKIGKTFDYDDFIGILYSSVNDLDYYIETSSKTANGVQFDLTPYWRQMGTGALDTWKFLMNLEGTPSVTAKIGELSKVSLVPCFGGPAANLTYTKMEISDEARQELGIEGEPYINNGRLFVKCSKYGSAKIRIYAIAGGDKEATDAVMGGTEFSREVSLLARESVAENGGWL
ncbi:MAG: S8 family serine peptidase [Bacteroidales bacterium]|nr:S8 family serine peptidase [Bacteroidales bacterium]